jgi:hypothetical protein
MSKQKKRQILKNFVRRQKKPNKNGKGANKDQDNGKFITSVPAVQKESA